VHPVDRPPYVLHVEGAQARFEVDAPSFSALLAASALALSDATRPLGQFEVWTARRVSVRGAGAVDVLEKWLGLVLHDVDASGFLPAIVEVERAEMTRASGIHRGGIPSEESGPSSRRFRAVVHGETVVEPGGAEKPWRARFSLRLAPA